MKKFLIVLLLISFVTPAFGSEYKAKTSKDITQLLQQFYQEEHGNRLSGFAMQSLAARTQNIFNKNIVVKGSNATKSKKH